MVDTGLAHHPAKPGDSQATHSMEGYLGLLLPQVPDSSSNSSDRYSGAEGSPSWTGNFEGSLRHR